MKLVTEGRFPVSVPCNNCGRVNWLSRGIRCCSRCEREYVAKSKEATHVCMYNHKFYKVGNRDLAYTLVDSSWVESRTLNIFLATSQFKVVNDD